MTIANLARRGVLVAAVALCACTDWAGYDLDRASGSVPAFSPMRTDVTPDPDQMPREPVPGTVPTTHPLGDVPATYTQAQLDSIAPTLGNPLPRTPQVLARGRLQYERNCAVCHGAAGDGQGSVINAQTKFPYAPALNAGPAQARSDGYIYAVIDVGRGLMPPYGNRITHLDRWAVVHYVRQLQGTQGAQSPPPAVTPAGAAADSVPAPAPPATQPGTVQDRPGSTVP
ncbi:MAG TPA: cytochrome c [Longimicrobiaceae bacterium]|nr:cytochrome c [Longimicrobiaceae bacterium]